MNLKTALAGSVILALFIIAVHLLLYRPKLDEVFGKDRKAKLLDPLRILMFLVIHFLPHRQSGFVGNVKKLIYHVAFFCFIILMITGFLPRLVFNETISGYFMMVHVTFAPVFAICVCLLSIMYAKRYIFSKGDFPYIESLINTFIRHKIKSESIRVVPGSAGSKICFWILAFLTIPLVLTIILSMLPIFDLEIQEELLTLHRCTAVGFSFIAILHLYFLLIESARKM